MKAKFPIYGIILLLLPLLLSGCWGKKELTDLAFVSALGFDVNENGGYTGTFQIFNPGNVSMSSGGGEKGPAVSVYTAEGKNIVELSRRASSKVSRKLYYAHANLVVISEELAKKKGIIQLFDALDRDPEFRITASVVIAQGSSAADIVKTLTPIDKNPAEKVINNLKYTSERWGEDIKVNIKEVIHSLISTGKDPAIGGFKINGDSTIGKKADNIQASEPATTLSADGIAVFKQGKLIDWFHDKTARGAVWGLNLLKATDINIDWDGQKESIAYEVMRQKTKISADTKDKLPSISIDVSAEGDIGEATVPVNLQDRKVLSKLQHAFSKEIKEEIETAIERAKENKSDIFGFGEAIHRKDPKLWKEISKDWKESWLPKLKVKVRVESFIRRTGLRNKPYINNE
ncbi:Ger(x)C family spore germination protein [Metabacillus sp. RGM 3146]|uniref:Ger(x)C family spore germination protein n=1 Tax=Metabacillus sp. RGM 3146 TaxID=3401092 RepID=UPI003B9B6A16